MKSIITKVFSNYSIVVLICLIAVCESLQLNAQVDNNQFNIQINSTGANYSGSTEGGNEEPAIKIGVCADQNGSATSLLPNPPNVSVTNCGTATVCETWDAQCHDGCLQTWAPLKLLTAENRSTAQYDIHVAAWENDSDPRCDFNGDDDELVQAFFLEDVQSQTPVPARWHSDSIVSQGVRYFTNVAWRPTHGTRSSPLDFGVLNQNQSKSHVNSNYSKPSGADNGLGYSNLWTEWPGNDVTYTFEIKDVAKRVTINPDIPPFPNTTWGNVTRLYKSSPVNGDVFQASSTSSISYSDIIRDLCPGIYKIVIDGTSVNAMGGFQMNISAAPVVGYSPGTILASSNEPICEGASIPAINSIVEATSYNDGVANYQWQELINNQWQNLNGRTSASLTNPGTMGTQNKLFRRVATTCGITGSTDPITVNFQAGTIDEGIIALSGSDEVRTGTDPGTILSTTDATGSPGPLVYSWEECASNCNVEFNWVEITNSPNSAQYDIPILNQTTSFRRRVINDCGQSAVSNAVMVTTIDADGSIAGMITAPPVNALPPVGIPGIQVCAEPLDMLVGAVTECDTTDQDGNYNISELYYGSQEIDYKVTPLLAGRMIRTTLTSDDSTRTETLNESPNTRNLTNVNFFDLTAFTIQGNVFQEYESVNFGKVGVVMFADGIPSDTTDEEGNYALVVAGAGTFEIEPRFVDTSGIEIPALKHGFLPESRTIDVADDVVDINFQDTTTSRIEISVTGSCNESTTYLGTVKLSFTDLEKELGAQNSFVRDFRTTNLTGVFSEVLPARQYKVAIVSEGTNLNDRPEPYPYDNITDVQNQLSSLEELEIDARFLDREDQIFYNPPIDLVLDETGFDVIMNCNGTLLEDLIFMQRGDVNPEYELTVFEGPAANGCLLDTGYVDIDDVIADNSGILPISKGAVINSMGVPYRLMAGEPVLAPPYTKTSTYTANTLGETSSDVETLTVIVEGDKARNKTFATVSPSIPLLVLHDPPTDNGYSFVEETSERTIGFQSFIKDGTETGAWGKGLVGFESTTEVGVGISIGTGNKVWATANGSIDGVESNTDIDQRNITFSTTQRYQTSETLIGEDGDLYIGAALNIIYANTDQIIIDQENCSVSNDVGMIIEPNNIETTFVLNTIGVKNQIARLKNIIQLHPDSTIFYQSQIAAWENTLEDTQLYKQAQIASGQKEDNFTYNGGQPIEPRTVRLDSAVTTTHEFIIEVDKGVALEAGFEIAGAGLSGGEYINFKLETVETETNSETNSFESGFVLFDDDPNDSYTIDLYTDGRYNTPFFDAVASVTSCPWEGAPQEDGGLEGERVNNFVVALKSGTASRLIDIDPSAPAEFTMVISNISPLFTGNYQVRVDPSYNPDNAIVELSGFAAGVTGRYMNVAPNGSVEVGILVRHPGTQTFSFNNLRLIVEPECSPTSTDILSRQVQDISVSFLSPCSSIRIDAPANDRILNIDDDNEVQIVMKDYVKSQIDRVTLQYARRGSGNWTNSSIVLMQDDLNVDAIVNGTGVFWDFSEIIDDGEYELRLQTVCGTSINYSLLVNILIDRQVPTVFGLPFPLDDVYSFEDNDLIGVAWNEPISCNGAMVTIVDVIQGDTLPLSQAALSCFDNVVDIIPPSFVGREPSVYRVILSGISDRQGNSAEEYRWVFAVGEVSFEQLACLPELLISNNNLNQNAISLSAYRALSIVADGLVPNFGETSFTAQEDIVLSSGFAVNNGGSLVAQIEDCDAPIVCSNIISIQGVTNGINEDLRFEIIEDENCVADIFLEDNVQTNDIIVSVGDLVTAGDFSQVEVELIHTQPLGAGVISDMVNLNLDAQPTSVILGNYNAITGGEYSITVVMAYQSTIVNGVTNYKVTAHVELISA